jgi:hypothetical protein
MIPFTRSLILFCVHVYFLAAIAMDVIGNYALLSRQQWWHPMTFVTLMQIHTSVILQVAY